MVGDAQALLENLGGSFARYQDDSSEAFHSGPRRVARAIRCATSGDKHATHAKARDLSSVVTYRDALERVHEVAPVYLLT